MLSARLKETERFGRPVTDRLPDAEWGRRLWIIAACLFLPS